MTTLRSAKARAPRTFSVLILAAVGTLGLAASAHAGTYKAKFCVQGVTADQDKGPFERSGNETVFALSNNCANLNGLRISHNAGQAGSAGTNARWMAQRPDGISVAQIDYKAAANEKSGGYVPQVIGDANGDSELDVIQGAGKLQGSFSDFTVTGDVRRFGIQLLCTPNNADPSCGTDPDNPDIRLRDVTYTLNDPAPPSLSVSGGTLFEGDVQTGAQSVAFSAGDAGSGVRRVVVYANGERAGSTGGKCALGNGFGLTLKPCPGELDGQVEVNTAAAPWHGGINRVKVCAEDYSTDGTQGTTCSGVTKVRVLNGCSIGGAPAQTLELQWPGKRNAAIQARQGRARSAVAKLFGAGGTPLAGATVCLSRSIPDGRGLERVIEPGAVTGADGSVTVKVRGASSRTVYATYWVDSETMVTSRLEMRVAPRIKLGLRPGKELEQGEKMLVVAKLRGKWKAGRKVCFYAERPGNDKIGCAESGEGGRAKAEYVPKETGRTYFYAQVPNQKDYPYVNARSKKKHAKVIG